MISEPSEEDRQYLKKSVRCTEFSELELKAVQHGEKGTDNNHNLQLIDVKTVFRGGPLDLLGGGVTL